MLFFMLQKKKQGLISPAQSSSQIRPLPKIPPTEKETPLYKVCSLFTIF